MSLLANSEIPVVQEDFETEGQWRDYFKPDSTANWVVEDGVLLATRGGNATGLVEISPDCVVEIDVTFIPDSEGSEGFAGIRLGGDNGCLFVIKSVGFWYIYREQEEQRSLGKMLTRDIEPDRPYRFRITRHAVDGGYSFSWEVDGELIAEFMQLNPPEGEDPGKLALFAWHAKARYDNIVIRHLEAGKANE